MNAIKKLSIKQKLSGSFILLVSIIFAMSLFNWSIMSKLGGKIEMLVHEDFPLVLEMAKITSEVLQQEVTTVRMLRHNSYRAKDPSYRKVVISDFKEFEDLSTSVMKHLKIFEYNTRKHFMMNKLKNI